MILISVISVMKNSGNKNVISVPKITLYSVSMKILRSRLNVYMHQLELTIANKLLSITKTNVKNVSQVTTIIKEVVSRASNTL